MCRCSNPCGITVSSSGSPPLRSVMSPTWPAGKTLHVDFAVVSDDCIKTLMPDSVIWRRYEANQQFLRDWAVEAEMLGLLRFAWTENLSHQRNHCTTSPHQAEDEWLLLLREGHWCCSHASIQGESKQRKFLSEKMLFDRFTLSSTWTRAASMCASPSLTPTISINATCFNWCSFYFIKTDAKYVSTLWPNLFCRSAAKNYFIKYGELGALNCAAERVS